MKRPEPRSLIVIGGNDELTVSTKLNIVHRLRMPAKFRDQLSIERIPHAHSVVSARGHHKLAVRTKQRVRERSRVAAQFFDELTIRRPKPRRAVAATGHDRISVRTKTHARNVVAMSAEAELHLARGDVPHRRRILPV